MSGIDKKFYERASARARSMSVAEGIELLKRAGVFDESGRLAERYRPDRDRSAAAGDEPGGHRVSGQR